MRPSCRCGRPIPTSTARSSTSRQHAVRGRRNRVGPGSATPGSRARSSIWSCSGTYRCRQLGLYFCEYRLLCRAGRRVPDTSFGRGLMRSLMRLGAAVGVLALIATVLLVLPAASVGDPADDAPISAAFHGKSKNGVYIVRLGALPAVTYDGGIAGYAATKPARGEKIDPNSPGVAKYVGYLNDKHDDALSKVGGGQKLYDYGYAVDGFAAKLSYAQAVELASQDGVLSVEPDLVQHADTITTPDFLGLSASGGTWDQLGGVKNAGEGLVIGDIDTGIWPENPEFSDRTGTGPNGQSGKLDYQQIPGWHGKCTPGEAFNASNCNQKLIGAQYFVAGHGGPDSIIPEEFLSPRDFDGHGSHTASTAAGDNGTQITGANIPVALQGKGSGMAPRARRPAQKTRWEEPHHSP